MNINLNNLDLNDNETSVYLALISQGPTSIRTIALHAELNRGTAYESLKSLVKKGLVSYSPKGKRKYFKAEKPDKLLDIANEKKEELQKTIETLNNSIIPALQTIDPSRSTPQIQYYEGDEGIEQILKDVLKTVEKNNIKRYYVYSSKTLRSYLYGYFPHFTKSRVNKKIHVDVIAIGEGGEEAEFSKRKWIKESNDFKSTSYSIIYPPKYAVISLSDEDYPYGLIIEEESISLSQKLIFEALWKNL